jgi:hypothetical protein
MYYPDFLLQGFTSLRSSRVEAVLHGSYVRVASSASGMFAPYSNDIGKELG